MEMLESRRLLSVTLGDDGVLVVDGTPRADTVLLSRGRANPAMLEVRLNGQLSTFPLSSVGSVVVRTGDGNDRIAVLSRNGDPAIDVRVFAGAGHDRITLGAGNDTVDAGSGNDTVHCGGGDDLVAGGDGRDVLFGGDGRDVLLGGSGHDRLDGGRDDDLCSGGDGRDVLAGGVGDDLLYGDAGNDLCDGGAGHDRLFGGDGNDQLRGHGGDDDLFGEAGRDLCDGGAGNDYIVGGDDADLCRGGTGNDTFSGFDQPSEWRDKRVQLDDICLTVDDLPVAVRTTLDTQFTQPEILKIDPRTGPDGGVVAYELIVRSAGLQYAVTVAADGTLDRVQAEECPPTVAEQLPQAVRDHLAANYPDAELYQVRIEGGGDDALSYDVLLSSGGRCHELRYLADGTVVRVRIDGIESA
ncbi:MAG: calcium-binding protein [Tepidisphaerales bacterium]